MLFILLVQGYAQYILEGINILEQGLKFKLDQNYFFPQQCNSEFDIRCYLDYDQIPERELEEKKSLNFQVNMNSIQMNKILDQLEYDQVYHPYYQRAKNQILHRVIFYEQKEDFLSVIFNLHKNVTRQQNITHLNYLVDLQNRSIINATNSSNYTNANEDQIMISIDGVLSLQDYKQKKEEFYSLASLITDNFEFNTKDRIESTQIGKIEFSKGVYIYEMFVRSMSKYAKIEFRYDEFVTSTSYIKQDQYLHIVNGPFDQLTNNIQVYDEVQVGQVHIKTEKKKLSYKQLTDYIQERFIEVYGTIHQSDLHELNLILKFINRIAAKIKQQKKENTQEKISISTIILQIENEMNKNEIQQFQEVIKLILSLKLDEDEMMKLQEQLNKLIENDL